MAPSADDSPKAVFDPFSGVPPPEGAKHLSLGALVAPSPSGDPPPGRDGPLSGRDAQGFLLPDRDADGLTAVERAERVRRDELARGSEGGA